MVASLRRFLENEVAQQRLKIIKFYEKYGEEATKEAFGVDRKLISKWRKRLKENGGRLEALVPHLFSYPRCPKINAHIERYNRTIQEEFIDNHVDIIHDKRLFHQQLADYLIFYNTKRIHKSLNKKTPIQFIIEKGGMSQKSLSYTSY
ncbi:hypothetical protein JZK55_15850 [Dissulfurispira thermophila]|uniref:Integrase catalytic domain-containing protein n=1 Tax=Dissulfurispira thermophila TaxID=2715679 RepID=A0A7G1H3G7_9BACT|nr:integrase core domain-containing protein [Dissulfurispira thermophila]BCB96663.1 hypothetical protein JZK55_15850 [Dissulfurispira thermophila]